MGACGEGRRFGPRLGAQVSAPVRPCPTWSGSQAAAVTPNRPGTSGVRVTMSGQKGRGCRWHGPYVGRRPLECRAWRSETRAARLSAAQQRGRAAPGRGWYQYVHRTHALSESYLDSKMFKLENSTL